MKQYKARLQLEADICVLILEQLPDLRDKLAFASACRTSRAAARDPNCWKEVDVTNVMSLIGDQLCIPEGQAAALLSTSPVFRFDFAFKFSPRERHSRTANFQGHPKSQGSSQEVHSGPA